MENSHKDPGKLFQLEKYLKKSIKMALQDVIPWSTLTTLLNDMASSLAECRLLIKILVKELQFMHKQKQVENVPETIEKEEPENDDPEIIEDLSTQKSQDYLIHETIEIENIKTVADDDSEMNEKLPEGESFQHQEVDDEQEYEGMHVPEAYDLKDFYTFVGSNEDKVKETKNERSDPKVMENQRKSKDQLSIDYKKDQEFEVRDYHPKNILEKGRHKCSVCLKSFSTKGNLKLHGKIHSEERHYECKTCKKRFAHLHNLKIHERLHTGEKPFQCKGCAKSFTSSGNLQKHERTHKGEKPFECKYCKKCFSQSAHLKTHERIHTGEKPFHCKYCKECFSQSSHLQSHERIHTGVKPYECKYCKKCFSMSSTLGIHERTHTGEKPFQCKYCKECFTVSSNLNKHERIHTGEVPFECLDCGKRFKQSNGLNYHKSTHSNERPFQCKTCGKKFKTSSSLYQHNRTHKAQ